MKYVPVLMRLDGASEHGSSFPSLEENSDGRRHADGQVPDRGAVDSLPSARTGRTGGLLRRFGPASQGEELFIE